MSTQPHRINLHNFNLAQAIALKSFSQSFIPFKLKTTKKFKKIEILGAKLKWARNTILGLILDCMSFSSNCLDTSVAH